MRRTTCTIILSFIRSPHWLSLAPLTLACSKTPLIWSAPTNCCRSGVLRQLACNIHSSQELECCLVHPNYGRNHEAPLLLGFKTASSAGILARQSWVLARDRRRQASKRPLNVSVTSSESKDQSIKFRGTPTEQVDATDITCRSRWKVAIQRLSQTNKILLITNRYPNCKLQYFWSAYYNLNIKSPISLSANKHWAYLQTQTWTNKPNLHKIRSKDLII